MNTIFFQDTALNLKVSDYQLSCLISQGLVEVRGGEAWGFYSRNEIVHYVAAFLS